MKMRPAIRVRDGPYYDWSVRFHPESRRKSCESVFKMDRTVKPGRRGEAARHEGGWRARERARWFLLTRLCRESNGQSPFSKSSAAPVSSRVARSVGLWRAQSVGRHIPEHFSYSRHAARPAPDRPVECGNAIDLATNHTQRCHRRSGGSPNKN